MESQLFEKILSLVNEQGEENYETGTQVLDVTSGFLEKMYQWDLEDLERDGELSSEFPTYKELKGYENYIFKIVKIDGYHHNDGTMVEYRIEVVNPDQSVKSFETLMCLSEGWNFDGPIDI